MSLTPPHSVLIALTSHSELGRTGRRTGAYLPEIAHPWRVFRASGLTVDLVSVTGARPPLDGVDESDAVQAEFLADPEMSAKLSATRTPGQVHAADYDVIFFAGGHGAMWDFPDDTALAALTRDIYEAGGVVAAVCHGPAALVNVRLSDGRPLVEGRTVSCFTNEEESAVGLSETVPFLLQTRLEEAGAKHTGTPSSSPASRSTNGLSRARTRPAPPTSRGEWWTC